MSRATKLTPELSARILNYIRSGAYVETAAAAAGISKQTFYTWLRQGSRPGAKKIHLEFVQAIEQAQAEDELRGVLQVEKLANVSSSTRSKPCPRCKTVVTIDVPVSTAVQLQAVTWKLERKYPERYGNTLRIEHRTQARVQELLNAVRPRMTAGAFDELISALEAEMGVDPVATPTALLAPDSDEAIEASS